jgi:ribonuclease BN (tRNA processing enzyme)
VPDHIISGGIDNEVRDLIHDVDVLLHDAQFVESERRLADAYAHSTVDDAVTLAKECGVRHLVLFHHGPGRTDDALDTIAASFPKGTVTAGAQGDVIDVRRV